jgi:WS/DGAT/MGAT family acyltransferase
MPGNAPESGVEAVLAGDRGNRGTRDSFARMPTRLSSLDASFLRIEGPESHMHVAWVAQFEPDPDAPRPGPPEIRRLVAGRLHLMPRMRQRLAEPAAGVGNPFWVDDERFALSRHVIAYGEPHEAMTTESWSRLVDALLSESLDRSRPLWQLSLVPRLDNGRLGILCRMHHAMVDGISALELGMLLLDASPDATIEPAPAWRPRTAPGRAELAARSLANDGATSVRLAVEAVRAARRPRSAAVGMVNAARSSLAALRRDVLPPAPASTLNIDTGPDRRLIGHPLELDRIRAVGRPAGATVNDVCLALVAGALRSVLGPGSWADGVKAMIPVSIAGGAPAGPGNHISFCAVQLPLGEPDPTARLRQVSRATRAFKASNRAAGTTHLLRIFDVVPTPVRGLLADATASPRAWNLAISNVPGPDDPVYLLGARMAESYPVVPIPRRHALAVGVFGYRRMLHFGLHADPRAFPAVADMPAALEGELAALERPRHPSQRFRSAARVRSLEGLPTPG